MTKNIIHMIRYSCEEDFSTICGINESCSERFYENIGQRLAYFGDDQKTTCKKCLTTFESMLKKEDSRITRLTGLLQTSRLTARHPMWCRAYKKNKMKSNQKQGRTFWDFASEYPSVIVFAILAICVYGSIIIQSIFSK